MSEKAVNALIIAVLFLIIALSMADKGKPLAAVGFGAWLLIVYGSSRVVWSERWLSEWRGWLLILAGTAAVLYLWYPVLLAYAGFAIAAQLLARFLGSLFSRGDRDDADDV